VYVYENGHRFSSLCPYPASDVAVPLIRSLCPLPDYGMDLSLVWACGTVAHISRDLNSAVASIFSWDPYVRTGTSTGQPTKG
jgi:hypothetical protein